jgi:amidase
MKTGDRETGTVAAMVVTMQSRSLGLALPAPRRDRLADFRILVVDAHPLCPTSHSVASAVNHLAERLARLGCTITGSGRRASLIWQTPLGYT